MNRRDFLKLAGAAGASTVLTDLLFPNIIRAVVNFISNSENLRTANNLDSLIEKMKSPRIICYSPTNYNPDWGIYPSESSINSDISLLVSYRFDGLITYGCNGTLTKIPQIAKELGMNLVITGVWDPNSNTEINNAIATSTYSDAFCVGNEQLNVLYTGEQLRSAVENVRTQTGKPVTTTQQVNWYGSGSLVLEAELSTGVSPVA